MDFPLQPFMSVSKKFEVWSIQISDFLLRNVQLVFLISLRTFILISIMAATSYIPINSIQEFLFLHTLDNICYLFFNNSLFTGCGVISHGSSDLYLLENHYLFIYPLTIFMHSVEKCLFRTFTLSFKGVICSNIELYEFFIDFGY